MRGGLAGEEATLFFYSKGTTSPARHRQRRREKAARVNPRHLLLFKGVPLIMGRIASRRGGSFSGEENSLKIGGPEGCCTKGKIDLHNLLTGDAPFSSGTLGKAGLSVLKRSPFSLRTFFSWFSAVGGKHVLRRAPFPARRVAPGKKPRTWPGDRGALQREKQRLRQREHLSLPTRRERAATRLVSPKRRPGRSRGPSSREKAAAQPRLGTGAACSDASENSLDARYRLRTKEKVFLEIWWTALLEG